METTFNGLMKSPPARRRKEVLALGKEKTGESFRLICEVLKKDPSPVIRHEAAFLLGATRNRAAIRFLVGSILKDKSDIVRHESIEALGDLGLKSKEVSRLLKSLCRDKNPFIKDTAEIALATLES